jgi:REP element-mobilizing transposase RayT
VVTGGGVANPSTFRDLASGTPFALAAPMSAPRQVLPGVTYLVSRRCTQRQFLLRPGSRLNQLFLYLLAVAARRHGIRLHAFCVLSNHYHLVLTDPRAELPAFLQYLDGLAARSINFLRRRWESFWAPDTYSAVTLVSPADIVAKTAYTLLNPVAAGLVRSGKLWPGLWSAPESIGGKAITVRRPEGFFGKNSTLPEEATLRLSVPPGFSSAEEFRGLLCAELERGEAEAARKVRGFLGAVRVLSQRVTDRPTSEEPRRGLKPRIAAGDKWKRIEALGRLVVFLRSYAAALADRREGRRGVIFPAGTYLLRVQHGVACAGAG